MKKLYDSAIYLLAAVGRFARAAFHARNGAQILIDGAEIVVGHVLIDGPRHDLEEIPVEWRGDTFSVGSAGAGRMHMVRIDTGANDGLELRKRIAAFRPPRFVGRQVAGNNVRERSRPRKRTEVSATTQIRLRIDDRRLLAEVRVATRDVFGCWVRRVAAVAVALCVHNIAA